MVPHEHLPLPVAWSDLQRDEGMMMGEGFPYLYNKLLKSEKVLSKEQHSHIDIHQEQYGKVGLLRVQALTKRHDENADTVRRSKEYVGAFGQRGRLHSVNVSSNLAQ